MKQSVKTCEEFLHQVAASNCSGKKRLLMVKPHVTNKCIGSAIQQAISNRTSLAVCAQHAVEFRKKQRCIPSPGGTIEAGDLAFQLAGSGWEEGLGLGEQTRNALGVGGGALGKNNTCVDTAGVEPTHSGPEIDCTNSVTGEIPFNHSSSLQNTWSSSWIESCL